MTDEGLNLAWTSPGVTGLRGGACGLTRTDVRIRALGELAERTSLHVFSLSAGFRRCPPSMMEASIRERLPRGCTIDLQYTVGRGLLSGRLKRVPAQWAACGLEMGNEPRLCVQTSVGTAAAPSSSSALIHALLELREREMVLSAWRTERATFIEVTQIALDAIGPMVRAGLERSNTTLRTYLLEEPGPFVAISTVTDDAGTFAAGAASRCTVRDATVHAATEACGVRRALTGNGRPSSLEARTFDAGLAICSLGPLHLEFIAKRVSGDCTKVQDLGRTSDWSSEQLAEDIMRHSGTEPLHIRLPSIYSGLTVERVIAPGSSVFRAPSAPIDLQFGPLA